MDQNVGIYLKTKESIRILELEDKMGIDQNVEIWVLIVKIYQNVDIWVKSWKTIKKLIFECNKVRINQNIEIWVQHSGINQNVEIWAKKGR